MAYVDYTDHGDGSLTFHDDMGGSTPPMAGPAALQQKNKIDFGRVGGGPLASGPELSPELMDAAAGPDLRTAGLSDDAISGMIKAPNGSIVDAGGAPRVAPRSVSDAPGVLNVPEFKNVIVDPETGAMYRRPPPAQAPKVESKPAVDAATQKIVADLDAKAGIPKTVPKEEAKSEIVPEAERVQINVPRGEGGLRFAPVPGAGAGSAPRLQEMKAGETYAYSDIPDEKKVDIKHGYQAQWNAAEQMGQAQEKAGQNLTAELAQIPTGLTALEQERQQREELIAQRVQEDQEELGRLREESRREIDPRRRFKDQSAAERFMGALALGIGAYVQTMTGGPNTAMQIMNKAIDDDIHAQVENRNAAHERIKDKRGEMAEKRIQFADQRQDYLAKKSQYLEHAQAKLATYMQDAKTEEQKAAIADLQGKIQTEAAKVDAEFYKVSHQVQTKVVQTGGVAPAGTQGISELEHERYVPQFGGLAPDKETRALASSKGASLDTFKYLAAENLRLREHPEAYIKGTDAHAKLASNQAQLVLLTKRKENEDLGVIAGPDMGLMVDALGDGTSVVPGQSAALRNFLSNQKRINENVRRNLGLIPVETMPVRDDKTGEIKIGQRITGNVVTPNNVTGRYDQPVQTVHIAKTARQEKK